MIKSRLAILALAGSFFMASCGGTESHPGGTVGNPPGNGSPPPENPPAYGAITGKVTFPYVVGNSVSYQALENARVRVLGENIAIKTDPSGNFTLYPVQTGLKNVEASCSISDGCYPYVGVFTLLNKQHTLKQKVHGFTKANLQT